MSLGVLISAFLYKKKSVYAFDFIQTYVNLEFDTCIFTGVEKYIIFDRDYGDIVQN